MSTTILEAPKQLIKLNPSCRINSPLYKPKSRKVILMSKLSSSLKRWTMHDFIDLLATTVREPILDIQERRGIRRYESQSFIDLIISLFNYTYNAGTAIFLMVFGLLPIFDGFLGLLRFCVDKVIEINNSERASEKLLKSFVFIFELCILSILTTLLLSVLVFPILNLVQNICVKAWGYSTCM